MANYPTSLPNLSNPAASDARTGHADQHANANDEIEAIAAAVGVTGSVVAGTVHYRLEALEQAPAGVTDHGALTGLADDDHAQYHTDARGDARYPQLAHNHAGAYEPAGVVATHAAGAGVHAIAAVTGLQGALDDKAASDHNHAGLISVPAGFNFDFSRLPGTLAVFKNLEGSIGWRYDETALIPESCKTAPLSRIIHVSTTGNDSNTGIGTYIGDFSNAKRKIISAVTAGNLLSDGYQIIIAPGTYARLDGFHSSTTSKPVWVRGWCNSTATRPLSTTAEDVTWTLDATYTNCYKASRPSALRAIDLTAARDQFGNYSELSRQSSAALCNTTPGSWYTDGTSVYVRRLDGAAPNFSNTHVLLNTPWIHGASPAMDIYISDMEFMGGYADLNAGPTYTFAAVDCRFSYQGGEEKYTDAITLLGVKIGVFIRCEAVAAMKDGFNAHESAGGHDPQMLTLDCTSYGCGWIGHTSNNGWTTHNGIVAIDVNGSYHNTRGALIACVNDGTQAWLVGTRCYQSLGDGTVLPTNFLFDNLGEFWLDSCTGKDSHIDVSSNGGAVIHLRNHRVSRCFLAQEIVGNGVISEY